MRIISGWAWVDDQNLVWMVVKMAAKLAY